MLLNRHAETRAAEKLIVGGLEYAGGAGGGYEVVEAVRNLFELHFSLMISSLFLSHEQVSVVCVELHTQLLAFHDNALQKTFALGKVRLVAPAEMASIYFLNNCRQKIIKRFLNRDITLVTSF